MFFYLWLYALYQMYHFLLSSLLHNGFLLLFIYSTLILHFLMTLLPCRNFIELLSTSFWSLLDLYNWSQCLLFAFLCFGSHLFYLLLSLFSDDVDSVVSQTVRSLIDCIPSCFYLTRILWLSLFLLVLGFGVRTDFAEYN